MLYKSLKDEVLKKQANLQKKSIVTNQEIATGFINLEKAIEEIVEKYGIDRESLKDLISSIDFLRMVIDNFQLNG